MATGDVWTDMAVIFTAILATTLASYATLTPVKTTRRRTRTRRASGARWFACAKTHASKAEGEMVLPEVLGVLDRERGGGDRDAGVRVVRAMGVPGVLRRVRGAGDRRAADAPERERSRESARASGTS